MGKELSGVDCRRLIGRELRQNALGDLVKVNVENVVIERTHVNEVEIAVNGQSQVIGRRNDGQVTYRFLWNQHNIGPFNCLGKSFEQCCELIRNEVGVDTQGFDIGCFATQIEPTIHIQKDHKRIWYQEYAYNGHSNSIESIEAPQPMSLTLVVKQGSDGKVHDVPALNVVIEKDTEHQAPAAILAGMMPSATVNIAHAEPVHSRANISKVPSSSSFVIRVLAAVAGTILIYFLCCVPIRDEKYFMDTKQVLESVNDKMATASKPNTPVKTKVVGSTVRSSVSGKSAITANSSISPKNPIV